jgi:acyl carrier protein
VTTIPGQRTGFAQASIMETHNNSGSGAAAGDDSIDAKILDIIVEHTDTPRDKIAADTRLFDLTDSLGVTEIVMACEDEFEGSIPDETASSIETVGQLTDHVKTHLAAKAVGG